MKQIFGEFVGGRTAFGLLVLRLVAGAGLMMHGYPKIQKPFGWMGEGATTPGFMQALAALAEFGGGAALILGLLTPLACLGIICTMGYAILVAHKGDPWIKPGAKTFELASLYLLIATTLLITGPGTLSLDANIFGRRKR
jgi:putative oxidoreductase